MNNWHQRTAEQAEAMWARGASTRGIAMALGMSVSMASEMGFLSHARRARPQAPTIARILFATEQSSGLTMEVLVGPESDPGVSQVRQLAMLIARDVGERRLVAIAKHLNRKTSTVAEGIGRARKRLGEELAYRQLRDDILKRLG